MFTVVWSDDLVTLTGNRQEQNSGQHARAMEVRKPSIFRNGMWCACVRHHFVHAFCAVSTVAYRVELFSSHDDWAPHMSLSIFTAGVTSAKALDLSSAQHVALLA